MRKSTTHLKDVSRLLSTTVDNGNVIPTTSTCRRNSHLLRTWLHAFPQQNLFSTHLIPQNRRSVMIPTLRTMSTSSALIEKLPTSLTAPFETQDSEIHHQKKSATDRLYGSLKLFNFTDRLSLADLDVAIQARNADKAWSIFITLASQDDEFIPLTLCCSLYALLTYAKKLVGSTSKTKKLRQKQLSQLLDYVQLQSSTELFLSSVPTIPITTHKLLLRAIRTNDHREAWVVFFRLHKESQHKLPRTLCLKLMLLMMKDKSLDKNQLKIRLQLIALHGAGTSEFDDRYLSAADLGRLAHICHGYQNNKKLTAHELIDQFVSGLTKKKQSIRADALDELIWRIIGHGDITKAQQVLETVQTSLSGRVEINEMVFVNLMNVYRKQKKYIESLKLFEQLLETRKRPTIRAFNAVLQIFAAQGSADRAAYIFESMIQLDVDPDAATYTEMIRANAHAGHIKTCIHFYNKMLQSRIKPNVYTYSALIEASSRRNDIKSILRWFQIMISEKVEPNEVIISSILKSLSKHSNDYPNLSEAVLQIAHQAAIAGVKTDAALYTILLKMQAESVGLEGALKIHRDMLAQSIEPNAYTYTILIDACGRSKMPETAEKIFELMKKSTKHKPNTVTYTALMDAWIKAENREKAHSLGLEFLKECKSDKTGRFWLDSKIRDRLKSRCC
jgi:pentatricopeptide repeat protein